jgi:hypothetical protein
MSTWLLLRAVQVMSYVYCLEITNGLQLNASSACASAAGLNPVDVDTCVAGPEVLAPLPPADEQHFTSVMHSMLVLMCVQWVPQISKLRVQFAQLTSALGVAKQFVPWVVVCTTERGRRGGGSNTIARVEGRPGVKGWQGVCAAPQLPVDSFGYVYRLFWFVCRKMCSSW